jgi:hypothetical protein
MTLEGKIDYIGGTGFAIRAVARLGLPALEMSDAPYGVRSNQGFPSTTYVAGIGLAASWNRELAERVGEGIGRDARARGVHYMLGPGVNIYRSPRNGRNFDYFGEDPFLASAMAVGYITGMQKQGVSATVKHFAGNNSEFLRHDSDSVIDERSLREIYLPAFEAAVKKAHVGKGAQGLREGDACAGRDEACDGRSRCTRVRLLRLWGEEVSHRSRPLPRDGWRLLRCAGVEGRGRGFTRGSFQRVILKREFITALLSEGRCFLVSL